MRALGIVCARRGSAGLKDKNLRPIGGVPLVVYTIDEAIACDALAGVVVSTDDERVARLAHECNVEVVERPPPLARDDSPIQDALRHALEAQLDRGRRYAAAVCLYANVPVRAPSSIERVVAAVGDGWPAAMTVAPVGKHHPGWMVRLDGGTRIAPCTPGAAYRRQDLEPLYVADGAAFAARTDLLLDPPRGEGLYAFLGDRIAGLVNPRGATVDVDDEADFEYATYRIVTGAAKLKVVAPIESERKI